VKIKTDEPSSCLIAESDQFIAKLLVRFAQGSGLVCVQANEGEDILNLTRRINPNLIILDAEFPGDMIGWEILRALKADKDTHHITLISCSWMSESEVRSLTGNLSGYLQKPDITYGDFEEIMRTTGILKEALNDPKETT